jgi:hypothetical protein
MINLAPRVGLEPTTKRLTAAHSTIELPGNKNLGVITRVYWVDSGTFLDFPQDISLDPCLESRRHCALSLRSIRGLSYPAVYLIRSERRSPYHKANPTAEQLVPPVRRSECFLRSLRVP